MANQDMVSSQYSKDAIRISRVLDAPRQRVFDFWTRSELMQRWWGPRGYSAPVVRIDARPGGVFHGCMRSADGQEFWSKGVYREVVPGSRIVVTDYFSDADGHKVPASQLGMGEGWPDESLCTMTFTEEGGKTRLTLVHEGIPTTMREQCTVGWNESIDKLSEALAAS